MRWCLLSVAYLPAAAGCSGSGRTVEYVIPDGHRGRVWVLLDPDAADVPVVDGRYRVALPKDGLLCGRSMGPFEQWHEASARYAGGTPLPVNLVSGHSQVAPGTVGMWGGQRGQTFPDKRDYVVWVVGTEAEFKAVGLDQFAPPRPR